MWHSFPENVFMAAAIILLIALTVSVIQKDKALSRLKERLEAEDRAKLMLEASPVCCQLGDEGLNIADCHEAAVRLYGFRGKQELKERFFEAFPELQPDGTRSDTLLTESLREVFIKGYIRFECMRRLPGGALTRAETAVVRVKHGDEYFAVGYTWDLREDAP
jgi:PAS domain-containing protein